MGVLSFLKNGVNIAPNQATTKNPISRKKDTNPAAADLRIFANGSVYPSATLVKRFNLEYVAEGYPVGYGFDIFASKEFFNTMQIETPFIMISPILKSAGKVDLFGTTRFNDDQSPISSVMSQGSNNTWLLDLLKTTYNVVPNEQGYIDLTLVKEDDLSTELEAKTNGIYNVPKQMVRGSKKGAATYVRRENIDVYVLYPTAMLAQQAAAATLGAATHEQIAQGVEGTVGVN
jgi:hypothetical protein